MRATEPLSLHSLARSALLTILSGVFVPPCLAQSSYVIGSMGVAHELGGPVLLGFDIEEEDRATVDGAVRIGTKPDRLWGVELEVASAGSLRREWSATSADDFFGEGVFHAAHRRRFLTVSALGSIGHPVGNAIQVVYFGGVTFYRADDEHSIHFSPADPGAAFPIPPNTSRAVSYGSGPTAGFEVGFPVSRRVRLAPGVRFHRIAGSWLLRPGIGVGWSF